MAEQVIHPIAPLFCPTSQVLILGSFPSVRSRQSVFFYAHPQNRFWRVLAKLTGRPLPQTVEEKTALVLENHLALWDVIASCEITGSSDSSIRNVVANDLTPLLQQSQIHTIFCNGATAWNLYRKYIEPQTGLPAQKLPSTSPANAAWSEQRLLEAWQIVLQAIR